MMAHDVTKEQLIVLIEAIRKTIWDAWACPLGSR
jgi:hypothetical protein